VIPAESIALAFVDIIIVDGFELVYHRTYTVRTLSCLGQVSAASAACKLLDELFQFSKQALVLPSACSKAASRSLIAATSRCGSP
jgi:hypothetical protein